MFRHTGDAPSLAPSFRPITEHYGHTPDAAPMLEQKLRVGGRAPWGDISMRRPDFARRCARAPQWGPSP